MNARLYTRVAARTTSTRFLQILMSFTNLIAHVFNIKGKKGISPRYMLMLTRIL